MRCGSPAAAVSAPTDIGEAPSDKAARSGIATAVICGPTAEIASAVQKRAKSPLRALPGARTSLERNERPYRSRVKVVFSNVV